MKPARLPATGSTRIAASGWSHVWRVASHVTAAASIRRRATTVAGGRAGTPTRDGAVNPALPGHGFEPGISADSQRDRRDAGGGAGGGGGFGGSGRWLS
jgi:hypothetical protein